MTVDILGSCVTVDAFDSVENDCRVNAYHARHSLISMYSPPLMVTKDEIGLASKFQQEAVYRDLTKCFRDYIKVATSDVLIIDFMDERRGVLKVGDTYITNSLELRLSELRKRLDAEALPFDHNHLHLWWTAAARLADDVKDSAFKEIVIHRAYYMSTYVEDDERRREFSDPTTVAAVRAHNQLLSAMYDFIENAIPGSKTIMPVGHSADPAHKWGPTPFHYEQAYYVDFMNQFRGVLDTTRPAAGADAFGAAFGIGALTGKGQG